MPAHELFPHFLALRGDQNQGPGPSADPHRYDRWLSPLANGRRPTDSVILHWARTWPREAPLLSGRHASAAYFPKGAKIPDGLLLRPGARGGSIHVYLATTGRVILSGSPEAKEKLLAAVEAWTVEWGPGVAPVTGRANLPPHPSI